MSDWERGTREGPPFRMRGFPAHKYYGLFLLFNRRFLSLMMDNFIFSLGLVVRTVDTSAQAGLWVLSADWWSTTGAMMRIMAA